MFPREEPVPYVVTETHETVRYPWTRPRTLSQLTIEDLGNLALRGSGVLEGPLAAWQLIGLRGSETNDAGEGGSCIEGCRSRLYARRRSKSDSNADMSLVGMLEEKVRKFGRRESLKRNASVQGFVPTPVTR